MAKHIPKCQKCNRDGFRHPMYDAYYCEPCNLWLEKECGDKSCSFCFGRPNTPFPVKVEYKFTSAASLPYPF